MSSAAPAYHRLHNRENGTPALRLTYPTPMHHANMPPERMVSIFGDDVDFGHEFVEGVVVGWHVG